MSHELAQMACHVYVKIAFLDVKRPSHDDVSARSTKSTALLSGNLYPLISSGQGAHRDDETP